MAETTEKTKVTVFGCKGRTFHVVSGVALLQKGNGYECPYCKSEIYDISDTPIGREYFMITRPDKHSPPPLRVI